MVNRQLSYPQPLMANAGDSPPVFIGWWQLGSQQKEWPLPSARLMIAFFLMAVASPILGGRTGISLLFLFAAVFPFKDLRKFFSKGDFISGLTIVIPVMTLGNYDALGDLWGSGLIRFSWPLVVLSGVIVVSRYQILKKSVLSCCLALGALAAFHVISTVGNTSITVGVERNVSYAFAFAMVMIALSGKKTRDPFVRQMTLVSIVNCGFCVFEILYPHSSITISSSRLQAYGSTTAQVTERSAGLYANAIASGLLSANCLLLAAITCTKGTARVKEKLSLAVFVAITAAGVLATFSRSAALAYFMAVVLVAFRLSNNRFGRLVQYLPFVGILILISFFGAGEFLTSRGTLRGGATRRYEEIKDIFQGDFQIAVDALEQRTTAWAPSKKLWAKPTLLGHGFGVIYEKQIFPPHNMIIMQLSEGGIIGLFGFLALLLFFCGFGGWRFQGANAVLFLSILMPILLLVIESHSFLIRRYFVIYLAELVFVTRILFKEKNS